MADTKRILILANLSEDVVCRHVCARVKHTKYNFRLLFLLASHRSALANVQPTVRRTPLKFITVIGSMIKSILSDRFCGTFFGGAERGWGARLNER